MAGNQQWQVIQQSDVIVHVAPYEDIHEHNCDIWDRCWCGAWIESVKDGFIVHHLNLTERLSVAGIAERIA